TDKAARNLWMSLVSEQPFTVPLPLVVEKMCAIAPELDDKDHILRNVLERLFTQYIKQIPNSRLERKQMTTPATSPPQTIIENDMSKLELSIEAFGHCFTLFGSLSSKTLRLVR